MVVMVILIYLVGVVVYNYIQVFFFLVKMETN